MPAGAIVGGSVIAGYFGYKGAKEAGQSSLAGMQIATEESRRQFDLARQDTAPWRQTGQNALNYLSSLYGLELPPGTPAPTEPQATPPSTGPVNMLAERKPKFHLSRMEGPYDDGVVQPTPTAPDQPLEGEYIPAFEAQTEFDKPFDVYEEFDPGEFEESPGYQFRLGEGEKGMQNYLAGNKMRLSGRALKEMERFRQGTASDEYGNFFSRQLTKYQQKEASKQNYISRLMGLAGLGQGAVNTAVGAGAAHASNVGSAATNYGNQMSNIQGQKYANYNQAIQGGMQNYLTYQQQQNMMQNWQNAGYRNNPAAGDAYMPAYA